MDQRIIDLYDEFTHGTMGRRRFFDRLAALAGGTAAASAALALLQNNYAAAQIVAETDPRITAETVAIPGVDKLSGYLVKPKAAGRHPAVVVIHENRGLNAHIKDVTRRFGTEGFVALGVDCLSPMGGTPDRRGPGPHHDRPDQARRTPSPTTARRWRCSRAHAATNGKVGAVGFCWGGAQVNWLAASDPTLDAGVPYYGRQPTADVVPNIKRAAAAAIRRHRRGRERRHRRLRGGAEGRGQELRAARVSGRAARLQQRHRPGALQQGSRRPRLEPHHRLLPQAPRRDGAVVGRRRERADAHPHPRAFIPQAGSVKGTAAQLHAPEPSPACGRGQGEGRAAVAASKPDAAQSRPDNSRQIHPIRNQALRQLRHDSDMQS